MATLFWGGGAVGFFVVAVFVIHALGRLKRSARLNSFQKESRQSALLKILGYTVCAVALLGTTLFSFVFLLFAFKDTPLHTGEVLPSFPLISVSLIGALLVGAGAVVTLRWVYKRKSV